MHNYCLLNTRTGKLMKISDPEDKPKDSGWIVISEQEFDRLKLVADYAMHGWYKILQ